MSSEKCPFCSEGELVRRVEIETYVYKELSVTVDQPGMYCSNCNEAILNGDDLKETRRAIHDLHAQGDGFLTSAEVKQIREKIGFTQKEAGNFFGGGVNAFSRYERGTARQSKAIDILLRLFNARPELLASFHFDGFVSVIPEYSGTWRPFLSIKEHSYMQVVGTTSESSSDNLAYMPTANDSEPQFKMVVNG